jgi:hypothetical protein
MENQPIIENQPGLELPEAKKSHTILAVIISVIATAAIAGGGVYFWQNMEIKKVQDNLTTAQNNLVDIEQTLKQQITDLQAQLTEAQAVIPSSQLKGLIEDWSLYTVDNSIKVGADRGENQEFNNFLDQANSGERKVLVLNGLTFVITPNYSNWSNEKFVDFNKNGAMGGVGGIYALHAYSDKLLWWQSGCGGVAPDKDDPNYVAEMAKLTRCDNMSKNINDIFSPSQTQ